MSERQFFRYSLALPLLVPLLAFGVRVFYNLAVGNPWRDFGPPGLLGTVCEFLVLSLVFGAGPYCVFASWAWCQIPHQPLWRTRAIIALSPFLTILPHLCLVCLIQLVWPRGELGSMLFWLTPWYLYIGYPYVVVVFAIYFLVRSRWLFHEPSNHAAQPSHGAPPVEHGCSKRTLRAVGG
jgi:hypothetical protein